MFDQSNNRPVYYPWGAGGSSIHYILLQSIYSLHINENVYGMSFLIYKFAVFARDIQIIVQLPYAITLTYFNN